MATRSETLLATAPGVRPWHYYVALVGTSDGDIQAWKISPCFVDEASGIFRAPHSTSSLTVRLVNPVALQPIVPIDADEVMAHPLIAELTMRDLRLKGYAIGERLVYCAFDAIEREWWIYRAT